MYVAYVRDGVAGTGSTGVNNAANNADGVGVGNSNFERIKNNLWNTARDKNEHQEICSVELQDDSEKMGRVLDELERTSGATVMPYARAVIEKYSGRLVREYNRTDNDHRNEE